MKGCFKVWLMMQGCYSTIVVLMAAFDAATTCYVQSGGTPGILAILQYYW